MFSTQKIKHAISWSLGVPSFLLTAINVESLQYWFVPFVGVAVLIVLIAWNSN